MLVLAICNVIFLAYLSSLIFHCLYIVQCIMRINKLSDGLNCYSVNFNVLFDLFQEWLIPVVWPALGYSFGQPSLYITPPSRPCPPQHWPTPRSIPPWPPHTSAPISYIRVPATPQETLWWPCQGLWHIKGAFRV